MQQRIKNIMVSLFDIKEHEIKDASSIDNVKGWDSLKHMDFVIAIEEEFDIKPLTPDQIIEMRSFAAVRKTLTSLINAV